MSTLSPEIILFHEEQRFRQGWMIALSAILLILGIAAIFLDAYLYRTGRWHGGRISLALVCGISSLALIGTSVLLWTMCLEITVRTDGVHVRFFPLFHRSISLNDILTANPRTYRPIVEYGGWGIRWSLIGRGCAWNVRGNRGVHLTLTHASPLLIGSQRADELAAAIARAKSMNAIQTT